MQTTTFLLVIAAAVSSLALVFFQYFHKNRNRKRYHIWLAILRFTSVFCALLLVINPKFVRNELSIEKAKLLLLVDNSESMLQHRTKDSLLAKLNKIKNNPAILERFNLSVYSFGNEVNTADTLSFTKKVSNISRALEKSSELFPSTNTSVALFTDGNYTAGKDYEFSKIPNDFKVWPIVVGDTATYQDLMVSQVNLNKYAFLGNQFPIESVINYQGQDEISARLQIFFNGVRAYSEVLKFQKGEKSKNVTTLLTAKSVGVKSIRVTVSGIEGERNTVNNSKETAIEVIDEKTKVLLVSSFTHPDLGAIKKAIESNEQRTVEIIKPEADLSKYEDSDILIVYQPDVRNKAAYEFASSRKIPAFTILGTHSDLSWVNTEFNELFEIELGYPEQEVFGSINSSFQSFNIAELELEGYPPLTTKLGEVSLKTEYEPILDMTIKGVKLNAPFMMVVSESGTKNVFLFGEDIWKWRLHNYRLEDNFLQFDSLFSKLMIYLSQSGKRNRLEIAYEKVYDGSQDLSIRANFYDNTFIQDNQADLTFNLREKSTSLDREIPMLFNGSFFEVDLSNLPGGEYIFTIRENNEKISRQGSFKILDFNVENQFLSANHKKLSLLADKTGGELYYEDQIEQLVKNLVQEDEFVPVQKNNQKLVPLIDFRWLLGLMVFCLSAEWFIRKYNGLL